MLPVISKPCFSLYSLLGVSFLAFLGSPSNASHGEAPDPQRGAVQDAAREKFFVPESDHLTLLHAYNQWKINGYSAQWSAPVAPSACEPRVATRVLYSI
jgi:hypothetical protein